MSDRIVISGGAIFDGETLHRDCAVVFQGGKLESITAEPLPADIDLGGDILCPGFTDLQVNGGGGVLLNDDPSLETIQRIAQAHHTLGTRHLLPTLITHRPEITSAAIAAAIETCESSVPGVAGLHLEGPHLSVAKKGAHDAALIRPMEQADLDELIAAANRLPCLLVTIAPENVTTAQVTAMRDAGILVSLGHTDADYDTCRTYAQAGASMATHLFNAMSQLGSRAPGLVGAALDTGSLSTGLIADGIHVHPAAMHAAFAAKTGPGRIVLVSDAMAVAGTELTQFTLGGRTIHRKDGRLTLDDGTLAGADLDLVTAIRVLVKDVNLPLETALQAATGAPSDLIGLPSTPENLSDFIRLSGDLKSVSALQT